MTPPSRRPERREDGDRGPLWAAVLGVALALGTVLVVDPGEAGVSVTAGLGQIADGNAPPGTIVAVTAQQEVVVFDGDGGRQRVVARASDGESLGGLALSPDGGTAYYHRVTARTWCDWTMLIESVPVAGGEPRPVAAGSWPAPSPDGRLLAFSGAPTCEDAGGGAPRVTHRLVVRDLEAGSAREWAWVEPAAPESDDQPGWPTVAAWSPDGSQLAYARNFAGGDASSVWLVDPAQASGDLGGTKLGPDTPGLSWWAPTFRPGSDGVVVVEPSYDEDTGLVRSRLLATTPGAPPRVLLERAGHVLQADFDASGAHLLFVVESEASLALLRRSHDDEPVPVASDIVEAVW